MKSTETLSILLLGALVLTPMFGMAQTETSAGASTETTVSSDGTSATGTAGADVAAQDVVSPRDAASGLPTGKRQHAPVIIRKELDKSTPLLGRTASGTKPMSPEMENRLENRDEMRDKLVQRASTTQSNREERRDEMREKMQERKSEILKRHATNMVRQMRAAIGRISKLADRMDSRIAKMKERGADTSQAEANIAIARTKITEASAAVKLAEDAIASAVVAADVSASSTSPSDPGKAVREALNKAKEAVFAAHKALVEAIKSLKGIRIDVVATTTASTDATTTTP